MAHRDAAARLTAHLRGPAIGLGTDTAVAVAVSGGLDSAVLLHAVARFVDVRRLRALHVDHGLQAQSQCWSEQCRADAEALGVPIIVRRIDVARASAESLEDAARRARYAALAEMLETDEVLLTAHHADDQLETLLYRLFRGTGIRGLRGIAERDRFGCGVIARPLLALTRTEILEIALAWGLRWIEDPMNADLQFDRNYIRMRVVPAVLERWPEAAHAAQRLARAAEDAEDILAATAQADIEMCGSSDRLAVVALRSLPGPRRRNALRHAALTLGLGMPDARHLARLVALVESPAPCACVQWPGGEARHYRDHVFLMPTRAAPIVASSQVLGAGSVVELDVGCIALEPTDGDGLPDAWVRAGLEIAFRAGGERFWPIGASRDQPLKQWFQEHRVVPWMRGRIPLVKHDRAVVAIADLALSDLAVRARVPGAKWRVVWHGRPRIA